jgi:hypothetical protein
VTIQTTRRARPCASCGGPCLQPAKAGKPKTLCSPKCKAKSRRDRRHNTVVLARAWAVRLKLKGDSLCPDITGDECLELADILGRLT